MQKDVSRINPVLAFDHVGVPSDVGEADVCLTGEVHAGEVVWIPLGRDQEPLPLVELALGLFDLEKGRVWFEGRDWATMNAFDQAAARGRCGMVFGQPSWISSLPVPENIALRLEHATRLSTTEIMDDAMAKARLAGLSAIDARRPDFVPPRELRVLEWIRAFVGRPALVVLTCPEDGAPERLIPGLIALSRQATQEGTAILWMSRGPVRGVRDAGIPCREFDLQAAENVAVSQEEAR